MFRGPSSASAPMARWGCWPSKRRRGWFWCRIPRRPNSRACRAARLTRGWRIILQEDAGPSLSEESLQHLTTIEQSAKRMGQLIDDLLAFSLAGRAGLQKTVVNLDELVQEVLGDFQGETKARNIAWEIRPLPPVRADRPLLRMVLVNLISNAVKFTGARAEAKIEIGSAPSDNDETVLFIRDNGAGFDQKYAEKLFGVFQRLHS